MLRFFTKFQRSRNFLLLLFCAVLLIGLVVFYIPSTDLMGGRGVGSTAEDKTVVAKVGSYEISGRDFLVTLQSLGQTFVRTGNTLPLTTLKALGLDEQALDRLIEDRLVLAEADRLSLSATDREVSDEIKRMPGFSTAEGQFIGREEYLRTLALRGENVEAFERKVRQSIAVEKMRSYLSAAAQLSDREIEEHYKKENTKVELVYAQIDNEKVRNRLQLSEADLRAYYDAHKDEFKATEAVRKVDYLFIPTDKVAEMLTISDQDLRAVYDQKKEYEPRASIIKLNVLAAKDEETVRAKINELNQRVRGTPSIKAEDFADVARGNSQDASASKGGDIGFIKKEPNRPGAWQQRAFNLKVGDIDGPFRDGASWYLMKITEQREVSFAQMRPTLLAGERNRRAYAEASKIADKAYEKFTELKDIRKTAEEIAKELKVKPETLIRSTPFFKNGDTLPEIGSNPAFEEAVGQLKKGEIGDKVGIPNGLAVPQLVDLREGGQQLTFEEARNQVEQKVRGEREQNLAQQRAQEIITQAQSTAEFEKLIKAEGLTVKNDTNFNSLTFPSIQLTQQARTAALSLKEGEVYKTPIKMGASYLIFAATKRTEADLSQLAEMREGVRQQLLSERQNRTYDAYIKAARKRYDESGKIKINREQIDALINSVAQAQQPPQQ